MPSMNGLAASAKISELLPGVPIVLHTLRASSNLELEAKQSRISRVVRAARLNTEFTLPAYLLYRESRVLLVQSVVRSGGGASKVELSSTSHSCDPEKSLARLSRIGELCLRHIAWL